MPETVDAIVIGGGIVGAACAAALSSDGHSVAIVEPGVIGAGATAAGMGHLVVMDGSEDEFALSHYSNGIWRRLASSLPEDADFTDCGTIWVAADEEEFAAVESKRAFAEEHGMAGEVLDAQALSEAEPQLRPGLAGGLLMPEDGVVYAPRVAAWLVERACSRGGRLLSGRRVESLGEREVRLDGGRRLAAGVVVLANGVAAADLVPGLPVVPKKGHLAITDRYPGFVNHQLIELGYVKSAHGSATESVAFNVQPRPTGQVLVGSSRQINDASRDVDYGILRRMLGRAIGYMPGLAELSTIRTWTGHRAATPDGRPLIGPWPDIPGLYLATGHEGLGITTSLGTARLIADTVAGREPKIPVEPYLPERVLEAGSG